MTSRAELISEVTLALLAFTDIELWGPNREEAPPDPTDSSDDPTVWGVWTPGEEAESDESTFGTRIYRGEVDFTFLTQTGGGELDYAGYATAVETILRAMTIDGLKFLPARQGDVVELEEGWVGRVMSAPYIRQEA